MIGQLHGTISHRQAPKLILDVNGVGYEIAAPMSTFYQLPTDDSQIKLWIHTLAREDALELFGFYSTTERELFRILIKVNGVGPKLALTILSGISVATFTTAVQAADTSILVGIPGVGPKTAQRLILDVKDKIKTGKAMAQVTTTTTLVNLRMTHWLPLAIKAMLLNALLPNCQHMIAARN